MSNAYGVTVPSGAEYPTQEFVDNFLNGIDNTPTCRDLQKLIDMGEEAAKAYIAEQIEKLQKKVNDFFSGVTDAITRQMQPIEPLIEAPTSLDDVLEYLEGVANYFAGPYNKMVQMTAFYTQFSAAAAQAIAKKTSDLQCLVPNSSGGGNA